MKPVKAILYPIAAWCALVFVYGIMKFPDVPYRKCSSIESYCGKTGQPHTESDYKQLKAWEGALPVSFPFGLISAIILRRQSTPIKTMQTNFNPKGQA